MQKRAKKSISIIAIACTVVFCVVVFALCVLDVRAKHAAELSVDAYEIHTAPDKSELTSEPEKASSVERAENVYSATPVPEKPKTVQTYSKSEAVQTTESNPPLLVEAGETNSNTFATVADKSQEEIIESGLEGEVDYDTAEIDKVLTFSLWNNSTEYSVKARDKNITEVVIPTTYRGLPVTELADNAFGRCTELTHVILPYGLKRIGNNAFAMCVKLPRLYIPETVIWIGNNAFARCSSLVELILPNNIVLSDTVLRP